MWFYVGQMGSIGSALVGFQCVFQGSYVVLFLKISRHIQYSNRHNHLHLALAFWLQLLKNFSRWLEGPMKPLYSINLS